jgi:hypothetical protein
MQGGCHTPVLQDSSNLFRLAQWPAGINLIRGHEVAFGKHRLEAGEPDFVIALCIVIRRRPILAREARSNA